MAHNIFWNPVTPTPKPLPKKAATKPSKASAPKPTVNDPLVLSKEEYLSALQVLVLDMVRKSRKRGKTCDELEYGLGLTHQTCSPRVTELARKGRIVDSGNRRLTSSNRPAIVWVAASEKKKTK